MAFRLISTTIFALLERITFRNITIGILVLKVLIITCMAWLFFTAEETQSFTPDLEFLLFCITGFVAQIIDGTLGMAYGVSCSTFLLHLGVSPAIASASVHTAEVFTTGVSGLSHLYFKNVDKKLFFQLAIPGIIGAVLGAFLLSNVFNGPFIKPFIAAYLLILGVVIIIKSLRPPVFREDIKRLTPLGFIGGLLDSIGGGGWGPIVTSNIIQRGKTPKIAIGTVNTAEFFVAFFSTGVFLLFLGMQGWKTILGLIIGGVIAAPIGPYLIKFIQPRKLMFLVGVCIVITSFYTIYVSLK